MGLSPRFDQAAIYAHQLHRDQVRKETDIPYVAHLFSVAALVLEYGGYENQAIAALLHDALEDQGERTSEDEVRRLFGDEVADIVHGCSDAFTLPKPPWRERKQAYLVHLADASAGVMLVSAADKLHNVREIIKDYRVLGESVWNRFNGGREGSLWYYRQLAETFTRAAAGQKLSQLANEFSRAVSDLEKLAQEKSVPSPARKEISERK